MDKVLYNKAIDETGTVDTESMSDSDADSWGWDQGELQATMVELEEIIGSAGELLEVHGIAPGRKAEGVTRLIYENVDGFNNRITNNDKLDKAKDLIDELQVDLVAPCEPGFP